MKVTVLHDLYNVSLTLSQLNCVGLNEAIPMVATYCGGVVWEEIETTEQPLPTYAKYIDTFYNINVYYDFVTESFLFEEF
jgi:hypothetical protein